MTETTKTGLVGVRKTFVPLLRFLAPIVVLSLLLTGNTYAASGFITLDIVSTLNGIGGILGQIAPLLSAALFILAGIFYAIGQILPPDKKAAFHTTSVNIIIGAVVLAALSLASTGLASVSTHLLTNSTNALTANTS
jgi:hypothetical protein